MKTGFAMVYDAAQEQIVAFGGRDKNFDGVDETWLYDCKTHTWSDAKPAAGPPYRTSHAMVYDPVRKTVLMFGGDDFTKAYDDLWEYDSALNTWTKLSPDNPPDARQMHGMTYDSDRDVVLMYGGRRTGGGASFDGTWEYSRSTNAWRSLDPEHRPPSQDHVKIAYDPVSKRTILFTGATGRSTANVGTWAFENGDWTKLDTGVSPTAGHASIVYDQKISKLVLIGQDEGSMGMNTWTFDGATNKWTVLSPSGSPAFREHCGMAFDELSDSFVLAGGFPRNDNWTMKIKK
ncbi:MAG: hypothetical protein IH945_00600 [Armatimonadetes bacterium]|nr:hypothetical protein [Armatimonadota bacterium]